MRSSPTLIDEEAGSPLRLAPDSVPAPETRDCSLDPGEGHDDFLMSIALVTEALASCTALPQPGDVRLKALDEGMVLGGCP
jgi:hypothetical protein